MDDSRGRRWCALCEAFWTPDLDADLAGNRRRAGLSESPSDIVIRLNLSLT